MKDIRDIKKGLLVCCYIDGHDCTINGITAQKKQFVLIGEDIPEICEPSADNWPLYLVKRHICGRDYWTAFPTAEDAIQGKKGGSQCCFGGNFVYSSDSRFPNDYPIPVHDRIEK